MKKIKLSTLAISVLVGGAVAASAAASKLAIANTSLLDVTNTALTWVDVGDVPTSTFLNATNFNMGGPVGTDGSGKIIGVGALVMDWPSSGTNQNAFSVILANVSGKISASKPGQPTTQLAIKGNGYTVPTTSGGVMTNTPAANAGAASVNLKFTSKAAPTSTLVTNIELVPTLPPTFVTNVDTVWHIAGTLKGSFKSGIATVADQKKINEAADLVVDRNNVTNFTLTVISLGNKIGLMADDNLGFASGSATVNKNNQFNGNLKALAMGAGNSSVKVKGTVGSLVTPEPVGGTGTNLISVTTVNSLTDIKGKIQGQAVQGASTGIGVIHAAD